MYKLKLGEVVTTIPTIGFNVETVDYKNIRYVAFRIDSHSLGLGCFAKCDGFLLVLLFGTWVARTRSDLCGAITTKTHKALSLLSIVTIAIVSMRVSAKIVICICVRVILIVVPAREELHKMINEDELREAVILGMVYRDIDLVDIVDITARAICSVCEQAGSPQCNDCR